MIEIEKLIKWDEAPMTHKHCSQDVDTTFRDILCFVNDRNLRLSFSGKVVVLGVDLWQILPVMKYKYAGFSQEVSIQMLQKWSCSQNGFWELEIEQLEKHNDVGIHVDMPDDLLIKSGEESVATIVNCTYPSFLHNINDPSFFQVPKMIWLTS